jgi:UDP:flavonoid glycosyltransferase YjiC (YdhE family)
MPTLILWTLPDVHIRGAVVKQLRVGTTRRLSATTPKSLVADLRTILAPEYAARARGLASSMRKASAGATAAADLVEELASSGRIR